MGLGLLITWERIITVHMEVYGGAGSVKGWDSYGDGKAVGYRVVRRVAARRPQQVRLADRADRVRHDQGGQNFMEQDMVGIVATKVIAPLTLLRVPYLGTVAASGPAWRWICE
ncbi:hypothetical protein [Nonomuraea sp. NPDC049400]|uniref:hypothetical protein n=1 Tax=Nonomuraea sp. NPDC049400 TaxID=3364352 RepID=UPI0037B53708